MLKNPREKNTALTAAWILAPRAVPLTWYELFKKR